MDTLQKKILCPSILNLSTDNMSSIRGTYHSEIKGRELFYSTPGPHFLL